MRHYGASLPLQAVAYPGADEALRGLRARGVRIALCTNKPERFIAPLLEALQWQTLFDAIVGGDTLAERKPSPAPLLYIAERFGVPAGQALMVGDSQTDADAAQAAGMPPMPTSLPCRSSCSCGTCGTWGRAWRAFTTGVPT